MTSGGLVATVYAFAVFPSRSAAGNAATGLGQDRGVYVDSLFNRGLCGSRCKRSDFERGIENEGN